MGLMDAKPVDEAREKRRRTTVIIAIVAVLLLGVVWWELRFWPEEHVINKFFAAIESRNFEQAYGIWMADSEWKQHPQKYDRYTFKDFYRDWGPGGEYGAIQSHKVDGASSGGSGAIVETEINGRPVVVRLWVEKSDKSISYPPN